MPQALKNKMFWCYWIRTNDLYRVKWTFLFITLYNNNLNHHRFNCAPDTCYKKFANTDKTRFITK